MYDSANVTVSEQKKKKRKKRTGELPFKKLFRGVGVAGVLKEDTSGRRLGFRGRRYLVEISRGTWRKSACK